MSDYTDTPELKRRREELVNHLRGRGIKDERVLSAMLKIPRHFFVPPEFIDEAYNDYPLPIGAGQTISQPYIVALMTEALNVENVHNVLEIGTGSGYQCAILAELAKEVYSVERIPELAERAIKVLDQLGYSNVKVKIGDGTLGWPEYAPYDRIMVTAGAPKIPEPLLEQLVVDGIMVIPVGDEYSQELLVVTKVSEDGKVRVKSLGGCVFVKLRGEHGWR
ncbi:MAG: protein-L-isoaspartate(D-aspartate) O-methyltransferase [Thermosulfidibacteraceae bacterium]|jgi:protein-L-isoaspartate(D-aspartate) O-methyltransferase